jgi:hypothetical protein
MNEMDKYMDPRYFRKLTDTANEGFKSKADAERQRRIQKISDVVGVAPRLAEDAAKLGSDKVSVWDFESDLKHNAESDLCLDTREILDGLRKHFENKGFKTELWGPGSDATMSGNSWSTWQFYISW